jgi:hypothetical protein
MWVGLLLVAPAVLLAALSVRRNDDRGQRLPLTLSNEIGGAAIVPAADLGPHEWRLQRDVDGERLLLLVMDDTYGRGHHDELLLYWSSQPTPDVAALLELDWPSTDEDWTRRFDLFNAARLPPDAVLLGTWRHQELSCFVVPAAFADRQGALIWFDLKDACIVDAVDVAGSVGR